MTSLQQRALDAAQQLVGQRVVARTAWDTYERGVLLEVTQGLAASPPDPLSDELFPFAVWLRVGHRKLWLPRAGIEGCPDAGSYNDEDAWNCETDKFNPRTIKVRCPHCQHEFAALCSPLTTSTEGGWRWVGCDHREPYTTYRTRHGRCGGHLTFTTYTPQ